MSQRAGFVSRKTQIKVEEEEEEGERKVDSHAGVEKGPGGAGL